MKKFNIKDLLNDQSKTAPETGTETDGEETYDFEIRNIPINNIAISRSNLYGIRDIEELAASIEQLGLLHNLVVKEQDAEGNYELISGERRYLACRLLYESGNEAYKTVPCKVEPVLPDAVINRLERSLQMIHANMTARVLTDYEKTVQAAQLKEILHLPLLSVP